MLTYREAFRVRSYECDLYHHVNNAVYFRYLQEARWSATREAGLTEETWDQTAEIEYLLPLRCADEAEITAVLSWSDINRTRWDFEIHNVVTGEKNAQAAVESIPSTEGLPHQGSISPDDSLQAGAIAIPALPAPPAGSFCWNREVQWSDLDAHQHVDIVTLLGYIEECGREVIAAHHWPVERMLAGGFAILLRKNQIVYRQPLKLRDKLSIFTWVTDVKRVSALRHYTVFKPGEETPAAEVHSLGVWVDLESGRPIRIPQDLLSDFQPNILNETYG